MVISYGLDFAAIFIIVGDREQGMGEAFLHILRLQGTGSPPDGYILIEGLDKIWDRINQIYLIE